MKWKYCTDLNRKNIEISDKSTLKNSHTERQSDSGDYNRNIKYIKTLIGYLPIKENSS